MITNSGNVRAPDLFEAERARLFGIAYRMLGAVGDAEDVVQDTYLRWQNADRDVVSSVQAFLTTIVTRLCLDRLRVLRTARHSYVGPWLPEPIIDSDPSVPLLRDEYLSIAMLRMLERLAPNERVVFVLREAFDMDYAEIALMIGAAIATCRQWYRRARGHLAGAKRFDLAPAAQMAMLRQLTQALGSGDPRQVAALLAHDAQLNSDGGGKVAAAIIPVLGTARIAQVLMHIWRRHAVTSSIQPVRVNGGAGLAVYQGGLLDAVMTLEVADGKLLYLDVVRNPDKLPRARIPAGDGC